MRVFLSYARSDDAPFVERLAEALRDDEIDVWFDHWSMPSRSLTFLDEIRRAIDDCDRVVAVMGTAARHSAYVRCEWQYALIQGRPVVPILRLGDYDLPPELRNLHCPDVRPPRPWKEAYGEIRRILGEPVPPLGDVVGLPSLPPHFRPRPTALSNLAATVMLDAREPVNPERWKRVTLLSGMGGAGKSVLASALARSVETRRAFTDGVFWLDMRRVPGPEAALVALAQMASTHGGARTEPAAGPPEQRLTSLLRGRRCLLVLDNVERVESLEPLVRCVDTKGRVLVTTRQANLVGEAHNVPLSGLEESEAREQLADWVGRPPRDLDADCEGILELCGGLPFAIALCGALIASGVSANAVATRLRSMDLAALEGRFPGYEEYPGLLPCLEVSVEALARASESAVDCLERMVIFPPGVPVPVATVALLWRTSPGLDEAACSFELARLRSHALVRGEPDDAFVSLHQLVHAYLTRRVPDAAPIHEAMLAGYSRVASADWIRGPDDGYYHSHLIRHLLAARGVGPACDLLVGSPAWMREKLRLEGSTLSYLVDVELCLDAIGDSGDQVVGLARLAAARHLARLAPRSFGEGILGAMTRLGLVDDALDLARANVDPESHAGQLLEIYTALAATGDERPDLLEEVERLSARSGLEWVAGELLRHQTRAGRLDDALRLWKSMTDTQVRAAEYMGPVLAHRLTEAGRTHDARAVAARSRDPSVVVGRDTDDLDAAERRALSIEDPNQRDFALMPLVQACKSIGDVERAHAAARMIQRPDSRIAALVDIPWRPCLTEALDEARRRDGPHRVLGVAGVAAALRRLEAHPPRVSLGRRLRRWLRREGRPDVSETPEALMEEAEREAATLAPAMRASSLRLLAQLGADDVEQWRRLLREARAAALRIEEPPLRARELAELAGALAQRREDADAAAEGRAVLEQAKAIAESASAPTAAARARAGVAGVLARTGRYDLATRVADALPEAERRGGFGLVARRAADAGDVEHVAAVVARCPDLDDAPRHRAVALARAGRIEQAIGTVADGHDAHGLAETARVVADMGHTDRALDLLACEPDSDDGRLAVVTGLAAVAVAGSESETRRDVLDRARPIAGAIRSTTLRSLAVAELARAEARAHADTAIRDFEHAIELANAEDEVRFLPLLGPSPRFTALRRIGECMVDAGLGDRALALADSLENEPDSEWLALRATIVARVAARGLGTGTLNEARADHLLGIALDCARRARNSIVGPAWQLAALLEVADRHAEAGRLRAAFEILGQAHFTLDPFVLGVTTWADPLEEREPGLSLRVVEAVAGIFGWQRPDWKEIADTIAIDRPAPVRPG